MSDRRRKLTRRAFMITGGLLGGGLLVGVGGLNFLNRKIGRYSVEGLGEGTSLNAWVRIRPDNTIVLALARAEMGQGVSTALPMLIAEELEVDMDQIELIHPQVSGQHANIVLAGGKRAAYAMGVNFQEKMAMMLPYVGTGGSTAVMDAYDHLRMVGSASRIMLTKAAAKQWGVAETDCRAEKGFIINIKSRDKLSYGELATAAADEVPPETPPLKPKKDFKLVRKPAQRIDLPEKVTGAAQFGLDARLPGMKYAAIKHSPIIGGKITAIKNEASVTKMPGVDKVMLLPDGSVAVVGKSTWHARNAALQLDVEVNDNGNSDLSTAKISEHLHKALETPNQQAEVEGDVQAAFTSAEKTLEATYEVPYLAHATMEPMNCTVLLKDGKADVYVGHQVPTFVLKSIAATTGVKEDDIHIHMAYLGGGFGRRAERDFLTQAGYLAKEFEGTPVQLVWSREEDMMNDTYRPQVVSRFKAGLDVDGKILGWKNDMALQSAVVNLMERNVADVMGGMMVPKLEADPGSAEGAMHQAYDFANREVNANILGDIAVQVGTWRSVGHSQNGFFKESFVDECAHAAGKDPLEYRLSLLQNDARHHAGRHRALLDKVKEMSGWGTDLGENRFRGVAIQESFGSIVAEVVEITKIADKQFSIDKFYCAVDCGQYVNPDTIKAQIQSGVIYGLTAAMYGEMTIKDGKWQQTNFPSYRMMSLAEAPEFDIHIMENEEAAGGIGEPGTPPAAPALTNAIFAATGERVRSLPLSKHGYSFS